MEPRTTADGSLTLYSPAYGQTPPLSPRGGDGVPSRLPAGERGRLATSVWADRPRSSKSVSEPASTSCSAPTLRWRPAPPLRYVALDRSLPDSDLLASLGYGRHLSNSQLWTRFLTFRGSLTPEAKPPTFHYGPARLSLQLRDATGAPLEAEGFDAIYLDAFSPDVNPELWSETFLAGLATALSAGGVLVSYSVKGEVRRRLARLGLEVARHPGPPAGKREMLWARKGA